MKTPQIATHFFSLNGNVKGAITLLFAAFFFSMMVLLIKLGGSSMHVTQILFIRQAIMTLIVAPTILRNLPGSLKTENLGLHGLRVGLALGAMLLGFEAVIHMPLADATAIAFAKSFFVTIFAVIILKEVVGIRRWAAVALGFCGVFLMLQPGSSSFSIYGIYTLISAACAGMVMVIIRLLSRTDSPTTILTFQAIGVGLIMAFPAFYFWKWPTAQEWMLLVGIGIVSYLGQMGNIYAYKWGEASVLASIDYARLLYATLFGYLFFADLPGVYTLLGAAIIIAASIYTIRREARHRQTLTRSAEGRGYHT